MVDVGLAGFARSGKDSVGAVLVGEGFVRKSFASPMRTALVRLNPLVDTVNGVMPLMDALYLLGSWEGLKEKAPGVRVLLQRLGSDVGREMFGEDFWVDQAFSGIGWGESVVFTDVRFPNEAEAIRGRGGVVWNVVRPGVGVVNGHVSESAMAGFVFDETVVNDGSLDDLREKVLGCLKNLG